MRRVSVISAHFPPPPLQPPTRPRGHGAAAATGDDIAALLERHGSAAWDIEFGGFLTNHLTHGLIALHSLGSPASLIQRFVAEYQLKLLPRPPLPTPTTSSPPSTVAELGLRGDFHALCQAYDRATAGLSASELRGAVCEHLGLLLDGLGGAAFHAFIHLCLGVRTDCRPLVIEGLAYLAHSWLPVGGDAASLAGWGREGQLNVLEAAAAIRSEGVLQTMLLQAWPSVEKLPTGYFQRCMHVFAAFGGSPETREATDELRRYARRVALPDEPREAAAVLLDAALHVFVRSVGCDYFLLHGVTAAFSLVSLLDACPMLEGEAASRACQRMLLGLLAAYVAQRLPTLCPLAAVVPATPPSDSAWDQLRREAVTDTEPLRNEHAWKMAWMCFEHRQQHAGSSDHALLFAAARKCLRASLTGRSGEAPLAL